MIPDAAAAISAAADIQRDVAAHPWPGTWPVRIRIGLHTGEPDLTDDGYVGMDIHLAARIAATGHGGQIVVSDLTAVAVDGRMPPGYQLRELGSYRLKGISFDVGLHQLRGVGLGTVFPPLRA